MAAATVSPRLRARLLGDLEARRGDGTPLPLPPSRRTRALRCFLVAASVPQSRSTLCEALSPRVIRARCFEAEAVRPHGFGLDALRGVPTDGVSAVETGLAALRKARRQGAPGLRTERGGDVRARRRRQDGSNAPRHGGAGGRPGRAPADAHRRAGRCDAFCPLNLETRA
jgi:hypothetical protein